MSKPKIHVSEAFHGGVDIAELLGLGIAPEMAVDFSSNILPFGPSPQVIEAIRNTLIDQYPDRECRLLRNAIAQLHSIDADRVLFGNGCSELIHLIASALIRTDDPVLIVGPTFSEYERATGLAQGIVHTCLAIEENGFKCPVDGIGSQLQRSKISLVWICNPNNPTGQSVTRERLVRWLKGYPQTVFVIDEAYIEFAPSVESMIDCEFGNLIVLRSMTKAYAMAGLRLGYAVMCDSLHCRVRARRAPWSVNSIAQSAGVAAINNRQYYANAIVRLQEAKGVLVQSLASNGFRPIESTTCFFMLPMDEAARVRNGLLQDGLVVRDCHSFGIKDYLRIAVHQSANNFRLIDALLNWKRRSSLPGWTPAALSTPMEPIAFTNANQEEEWDDDFRRRLNRLFRRRRDVRRFRRDSIPEVSMKRWIEAACLAPSVGLSQPWRFVSVSSSECRASVVHEFETQNEAAASGYDDETARHYRALKLAGLREAPEQLAIFVDLDPQQGRGLGRATMPESVSYSVVAAIQNFWLAARSEGVGVGWVSILRPQSIAAILGVTSTWHLIAYLCIGYPEDAVDEIPELERESWEQRSDLESHWIER
ncbi:MAG TPA: 5,6-dimethylbenzimidazole synthase [Pirellula sp.]|nr:5,6-dimethylbenzimidazole synthase [Pirellula sp.]